MRRLEGETGCFCGAPKPQIGFVTGSSYPFFDSLLQPQWLGFRPEQLKLRWFTVPVRSTEPLEILGQAGHMSLPCSDFYVVCLKHLDVSYASY
jgi:hypothetical protein